MTQPIESTLESLEITLAGKPVRLVLEGKGLENKEIWLLLPALSTVSSRGEWYTFAEYLGKHYQL